MRRIHAMPFGAELTEAGAIKASDEALDATI